MASSVTARACPNIALVKYWGKRSIEDNLPCRDSVAVVLDRYATYATAVLRPGPQVGVFCDGQAMPEDHAAPIRRIVCMAFPNGGVRVDLRFGLPPGIGFAQSAATYAALALALGHLAEASHRQTMEWARRGSGSAVRSLVGGVSLWRAGRRSDGGDCIAEQVFDSSYWPELRMVLVQLESAPKAFSSRSGMISCAGSSPLFGGWLEDCERHLPLVLRAYDSRDFHELGRVADADWRAMHEACEASNPPLVYRSPQTDLLLSAMAEWSLEHPVFATLDAGPNPVLFTLEAHLELLCQQIARRFPRAVLRRAAVGTGAEITEVIGP